MSETMWPEKTWTQEELGKAFPDAKTLQDIISASSKLAQREGSVVCEVSVNGLALSEDDEVRFKDSGVGEISSFRIKVERIETLLDESLIGCREYLLKLTESIEHASALFRMDDLVAAHKFYRTCVDGAGLFIDMISHYKIVYENARGPLPATWAERERATMKTLSTVLEAYKQKNYILVADMLEYDLIDVLVAWQKELSQLGTKTTREHRSTESAEAQDPAR